MRAPVAVPRSASAAQRAVLSDIEASYLEFVGRLRSCSPEASPLDASSDFELDESEQRLELDAARADCPERAGTCDPMPLLPADVHEQLLDADKLFSNAPAALERFPGFYAGARAEYLKLVIRQLRCGKLCLAESVRGGGTVFPVGKSSGNQREVWHGSRVSAVAARPPRPAHLASPTAFRAIELAEGEVLRVFQTRWPVLLRPASLAGLFARVHGTARRVCAGASSGRAVRRGASRRFARASRCLSDLVVASFAGVEHGFLVVKLRCADHTPGRLRERRSWQRIHFVDG